MPKLHLTTPIVVKHQCPAGRKKIDLFDTHTKGLMLEVRSTGGRTFYLRYTDRYGKTRQFRLADARDITLAQARKLANHARNKIAHGIDPAEEKAEARSVPTFRDFVYEQYLPYIKTYKRSWKCDESLLRNHLLPRFGPKHLDNIKRADIIRMVQDRLNEGAAPGSVNRLIILTRYMYNLATRDWKLPGVDTNPVSGVRCLEENNKSERYLSNDEMGRLFNALAESQSVMLRYIVAFLLLTGARRNEVLHARWDDIDVGRRSWKIPLPKGGKSRHVPLNDGALKILAEVSDVTSDLHTDFIFPNLKTRQAYVSIYYSWNTARRKAGLSDVRMHDLRHSFASYLINRGRSLYEVQELLGHTQVATTQRYAHLTSNTLLEASNTTAPISDIFNRRCTTNHEGNDMKPKNTTKPAHVKRSTTDSSDHTHAFNPNINILAGMRSEEQRIADEKAFNERFDYLENLGS